MLAVQQYMMKLAAEKHDSYFRDVVGRLGVGGIRKKELKAIEGQIRDIKPKTEEEKKIERLAGREWTKGQYTRGAGIGAGIGTAGHVIGSGIEGLGKGKFLANMAPRKVLRTAAIASLYGAALPAARRIADVEAAKRGEF